MSNGEECKKVVRSYAEALIPAEDLKMWGFTVKEIDLSNIKSDGRDFYADPRPTWEKLAHSMKLTDELERMIADGKV